LLCFPCRTVPPLFERAVAYAVYETQVREMIHLLKYERMGSVAKLLGGMLAEAILMLRAEAARDLVVIPVPLFGSKQRDRGYNQSELLAEAALSELRRLDPEWRLRRVPGVLARRRDTRSQFELNPTGRRRNLQGAFEADASRLVPGCEVLLIDDIYTTGATARECARVLRRAGARKVWVATLARAQTPRVALWGAAPGSG
jgi:ComF family protein